MRLSKTEFLRYLRCPESFWLYMKERDSYPDGETSAFVEKLVREGYEVEAIVRDHLGSNPDRDVSFQTEFETATGLYARADAIERNSDGDTLLYEIKSSTSVKTDAAHNHLKDVAFQKICAERAGTQIARTFLVHLNGEYVRDGRIDSSEMLVFADVTEDVEAILTETEAEIDAALSLLTEAEISRDACSCLYKSRAQHCDTFSIFNAHVPTPSIYSLPRLSAARRKELVSAGAFSLTNIPDDTSLTENQERVRQAAKAGAPLIDTEQIRAFLEALTFPLHFFDFETYASAVPLVDRIQPQKQFPVQYSLHVLEADGTLTHREFLEREARLPDRLLKQMRSDFASEGSVVSWHASAEKTQNLSMQKWFPENTEFLEDINERMVDPESLFKAAYVDVGFDGFTSIKRIQPVICPELSYKNLDVSDGSAAMDAWKRMIDASPDEANRIADDLLKYCERDTLVMVEIYNFLAELVGFKPA